MKEPAIFFDRDGTLMQEVNYCRNPDEVRVFAGVAAALQKLREAGWKRILVTNQSGIGRGIFSWEELEAVQKEFFRQIGDEMDGVYICPDAPDHAGPRRKPAPGMLLEAAQDHNLELSSCWMIGDKVDDMECARRAGVSGILVKTGYGSGQSNPCPPHFVEENVVAAVDRILQECKP
jgi:D-glycero-D-manno-heptose 1,7-bisphosphate phosphatase